MRKLLEIDEEDIVEEALRLTSIANEYRRLERPWGKFLLSKLENNGNLVTARGQVICYSARELAMSDLTILGKSASELRKSVRGFEQSPNWNESDLYRRLGGLGRAGTLGGELDADKTCVALFAIRRLEKLLNDIDSGNESPPTLNCIV